VNNGVVAGRAGLPIIRQTLNFSSCDGVRIGLIAYRHLDSCQLQQESRAVARKPRDAAAVLFGFKFADNFYYKFKSSQASKAMLQSSKHTGAKQNLTQIGHSRSFKV